MEDELLAAIYASPDDDGPRLVYADWLQQRGDPRGELIAVQCHIAAGDPDAPSPALLARERELLATHDFTAPLRAIVDEQWVLRRGFVEHVAAYCPLRLDDETAARLFEAAPLLHSMAIPGTPIAHPIAAAWSRFDTIELRELCYIGDEQAREFSKSPHLARVRRLHVVNCALQAPAISALLELPNRLEHFGFGLNGPTASNRIDSETSAAVVQYLDRTESPLRSIALGNVHVDASVLGLFPLTRLGLHNTRTPVASLHTLRGLERLELVYTTPPEKLDLVALLDALPALKWLRVRGAGLTTSSVLALVPHAKRLTRLDLSRNAIEQHGVDALCKLPAWLDLSHNPIAADVLGRVHDRNRAVVEPPAPRYPEDVVERLPHNKIAAIKLHREDTRAGLLESKLAVERINDELNFHPSSPQPMVSSWLAP